MAQIRVVGLDLTRSFTEPGNRSLRGYLYSPSGQRAQLFDWSCVPPTPGTLGHMQVTLDDSAASGLPYCSSANISGTYRPDESLAAAFLGTAMEGTWSLEVVAYTAPNVASLSSVSRYPAYVSWSERERYGLRLSRARTGSPQEWAFFTGARLLLPAAARASLIPMPTATQTAGKPPTPAPAASVTPLETTTAVPTSAPLSTATPWQTATPLRPTADGLFAWGLAICPQPLPSTATVVPSTPTTAPTHTPRPNPTAANTPTPEPTTAETPVPTALPSATAVPAPTGEPTREPTPGPPTAGTPTQVESPTIIATAEPAATLTVPPVPTAPPVATSTEPAPTPSTLPAETATPQAAETPGPSRTADTGGATTTGGGAQELPRTGATRSSSPGTGPVAWLILGAMALAGGMALRRYRPVRPRWASGPRGRGDRDATPE